MRIPTSLDPLVDMGLIREVVRPLMSGKEAQLYLVVSGGRECVAKVYKEAGVRSFKQRADYTDGRKVRNSRDRRAMTKRTRHGRAEEEAAWRSAEVDAIYKLRHAGVRVPEPYNYIEGVLLMEMITDAQGRPASRLGDLTFSREQAADIFDHVLQEVVRMLCAGVVHGDLSDFNILMGADGPVIIDFPQAVDPSSNSGARRLLLRDVDNLHRFARRFGPHRAPPYAEEMWQLFERGELTPQTRLSGQFRDRRAKTDTSEVLGLIAEADKDERRRRAATGSSKGPRPAGRGGNGDRGQRRGGGGGGGPIVEVLVRSSGPTRTIDAAPVAVTTPAPRPKGAEPAEATPKKRRRRRRRGGARPSSSSNPPSGGSRG